MQKSFFTAVQNSALRSLSRFQLEKGAIHHETLNSPQELRAYLSQLQEATQRSLGIQAQQAQEEKKQAVLAFTRSTTATPIDDLPPVRRSWAAASPR